MLDLFALVVLIIMVGILIAAWFMLAMLPGQIARKRNHPQADAINVMGWWGALTLGILAPIAWVWAYTRPVIQPIEVSSDPVPVPEPDEEVAS